MFKEKQAPERTESKNPPLTLFLYVSKVLIMLKPAILSFRL
jgi:hypothetical protein